MYQSAVETSRVFLRDTTVVQPEALLLFGGEISVDHASSTVSVSLGGGLRDDEKTKKKEKKKPSRPRRKSAFCSSCFALN